MRIATIQRKCVATRCTTQTMETYSRARMLQHWIWTNFPARRASADTKFVSKFWPRRALQNINRSGFFFKIRVNVFCTKNCIVFCPAFFCRMIENSMISILNQQALQFSVPVFCPAKQLCFLSRKIFENSSFLQQVQPFSWVTSLHKMSPASDSPAAPIQIRTSAQNPKCCRSLPRFE